MHVEARDGAEQGFQVGMARFREDVAHLAGFHHLAPVHDHDFLGDVGDHAQIVGDHQHRHAKLGLKVAEQLEDLRLDGDVEGGGRLVRDQQRRVADQRHGDHRALAETAGKLEGVGVHRALRIGEAHQPQHLHGQLARLGAVHVAVEHDRFADLIADGVERRQRGHRLLEDDRDIAAADRPHLAAVRVQLGDVDGLGELRVGEQDLALGDPGRAGQDAHDGLGHHRLARSGLAHQGYGAARPDPERDTAHRPDDALGNAEFDMQIADAQQISHWASLVGGSRVGNARGR